MKLIIASLVAVFTGGIALLGVGGGAATSQVPEVPPAAIRVQAGEQPADSDAGLAEENLAPDEVDAEAGEPRGTIVVPGADGSDWAFEPNANVQIDLSQAASGEGIAWDTPSPVAGRGVYDPNVWAVVFKYSSVNIPSGVTVTFKNHPSRAPVVWLVSGDVTIAGTVSVAGAQGHAYNAVPKITEPGPGGFRGGSGQENQAYGSAGFGPGGAGFGDGQSRGTGGSHAWQGNVGGDGAGAAGPAYGNAGCLPLIGGSGGSGVQLDYRGSGAGGGGGAILIAASGAITVGGVVNANGGPAGSYDAWEAGDGAGGAIRLVADAVAGSGLLTAVGSTGYGYDGAGGRIRVEANSIVLPASTPPRSEALPGTTATLWAPMTHPSIEIVSIDQQPSPSDPLARLDFPNYDVALPSGSGVQVVLAATNVPVDGTWVVRLRAVRREGADSSVNATLQPGGTLTSSTWIATLDLSNGFSVLQARAYKQ